MEVLFISGSPYEDYDGQVLNLELRLDEGESVVVGGDIAIPMIDGPALTREVKLINPQRYGDYASVTEIAASKVASGE